MKETTKEEPELTEADVRKILDCIKISSVAYVGDFGDTGLIPMSPREMKQLHKKVTDRTIAKLSQEGVIEA